MFLHALYVSCLFSRKDVIWKLKALLKVKYSSKGGCYSQECLEGDSGSKAAKHTQQFALVCAPDQRRKPDPSFLTSVLSQQSLWLRAHPHCLTAVVHCNTASDQQRLIKFELLRDLTRQRRALQVPESPFITVTLRQSIPHESEEAILAGEQAAGMTWTLSKTDEKIWHIAQMSERFSRLVERKYQWKWGDWRLGRG